MLFSHHVSKASQNKDPFYSYKDLQTAPRGGGVWVDLSRFVLVMEKAGEQRMMDLGLSRGDARRCVLMEITKNNFGPLPEEPIYLVRREGGVLKEITPQDDYMERIANALDQDRTEDNDVARCKTNPVA